MSQRRRNQHPEHRRQSIDRKRRAADRTDEISASASLANAAPTQVEHLSDGRGDNDRPAEKGDQTGQFRPGDEVVLHELCNLRALSLTMRLTRGAS